MLTNHKRDARLKTGNLETGKRHGACSTETISGSQAVFGRRHSRRAAPTISMARKLGTIWSLRPCNSPPLTIRVADGSSNCIGKGGMHLRCLPSDTKVTGVLSGAQYNARRYPTEILHCVVCEITKGAYSETLHLQLAEGVRRLYGPAQNGFGFRKSSPMYLGLFVLFFPPRTSVLS